MIYKTHTLTHPEQSAVNILQQWQELLLLSKASTPGLETPQLLEILPTALKLPERKPNSSHSLHVKFENERNYASNSSCAFFGWCLIKHMDSCIFLTISIQATRNNCQEREMGP